MGGRSDVRFSWLGRLGSASPVIDPCFDIDEFQDADPLKVGEWTFTRQQAFESGPVDNAICSKASAEHALPDGLPEMIEHARREAARRSLDAAIENSSR